MIIALNELFGREISMEFQGYFINLDRSLERRLAVESQLERLSLRGRYERFPAIDAANCQIFSDVLTSGEVACFQSHAGVLRNGKRSPLPFHVMEDDVVISPHCVPLLDNMCESGLLDEVDIIFTETYVPFSLDYLREYKALFDQSVARDNSGNVTAIKQVNLLELRGRVFAGMTSFLIGPKAISIISGLLDGELSKGPAMPVDLFIRKMVHRGQLRAKCVFPFTTSIQIDSGITTTIEGRSADDLSVLASTLIRHSFFVGCNWTSLEEAAQHLLAPARDCSSHGRLLAAICEFALSGAFRAF